MIDNHLIENRHIRVFISSTFQDMQGERDYLMSFTFPQLRILASERDVTLSVIDLRWGITEEESKNGQVVELCLKEIDNSIPFFIGIVGNRYGWIPSENDIFDSPNMKDRYKWVYDDIVSKLSVTEMEVQYGVIRRKEKINAFFYLKNSQEDIKITDNLLKLNNFKNIIYNNGRYPVSEYTTKEDLDSAVKNDFTQLLNELFPISNSNSQNIVRIKQHACISQLRLCYVNNSEDLKRIDMFINDDTFNYLTISGENGSGKSALLANWIENNVNNSNYLVLYYFTNGQSEVNPEYILNYWINELSLFERNDIREFTEDIKYEELKYELEKKINSFSKPIIMILDDVTLFQECDNWTIGTLDWIPTVRGKNKLIISTSLTDSCFPEYRKKSEGIRETNFSISKLSATDVKTICKEYLNIYGKKLNDNQIKNIIEFKLAYNPRMLITLLDELVNYGDFDTLNKFIDSFLGTSTGDIFYERYLEHIEGKLGSNVFEKSLLLIALSKNGLKENEIKECLDVNVLLWSQIYCISAKYYTIKNGCIQIASKEVIKAVLKKYEKEIHQFRITLINYLEHHLVEIKDKLDMERIWDELCAQYYEQASIYDYQDEMAEKLYNIISQPDIFEFLAMKRASKLVAVNGEGKQLYIYWSLLYQLNPSKYSLTAYLEPGKFSDEDFILKSADLIDTAFHANDLSGAVLMAFKVLEIYRRRGDFSKKETDNLKVSLNFMHLITHSWCLNDLGVCLKKLSDDFSTTLYLPHEETEYEFCLRLYTEAMSSNNINDRIEKLKKILIIFSQLNEVAYSDKAMLNYKIATSYRSIGIYNQSLAYVELAIQNMELLDGEYNDSNELFKAYLMEYKGVIYRDLGQYEDAYNAISDAIFKYEDIEDFRLEYGNMRSTIDDVMRLEDVLYEIQLLIDNKN